MLRGRLVGLRAIRRHEIETLHAHFDTDPVLQGESSALPWTAISIERRLADFDRALTDRGDTRMVDFAVQRLDDAQGKIIGQATIWGLDEHHRSAHFGIALLPEARGQGMAPDALHALCRYAFEVRDLFRVQFETVSSNSAAQRLALAAGFVAEGRLRQGSFVNGRREDELVYGLLASEWRAAADRQA